MIIGCIYSVQTV